MAARQKKSFDMGRFFQALGDNTRLRLINLMGDQEICVCYFVEILNQPQPKISRHLAYLRNAGIVTTRRDGKWMHYRIVAPPNDGAAKVLRETCVAERGANDAGGPRSLNQGLLYSREVRYVAGCASADPSGIIDRFCLR
jgi:DNA-binding transcriptional ArsR family regulator